MKRERPEPTPMGEDPASIPADGVRRFKIEAAMFITFMAIILLMGVIIAFMELT